jgi:very-short-patch-repair endonuclease
MSAVVDVMPNATKNKTDLADTLALHLRAMQLPAFVREYRPFPDRRFRLDISWPDRLLYVEVDGGELMQGRHNRAHGMANDCEKMALLTLAGWRGFRFVGSQVKNGFALDVLTRYFQAHP